jgi:transposase
LRKKPTDLDMEKRCTLRLLFRYLPKLKLAYGLQQQLTAIFDQPISPASAKTKIGYFVNRDNSSFVEGLDNKLKALKRRCYGLFNLKHLFQRIFLDLEGYRLFAGSPPYCRFTITPNRPKLVVGKYGNIITGLRMVNKTGGHFDYRH